MNGTLATDPIQIPDANALRSDIATTINALKALDETIAHAIPKG